MNFVEAKQLFSSTPLTEIQVFVKDYVSKEVALGANPNDKGLIGDALEAFVGKKPDSELLDLGDGEMKSHALSRHFNLTQVSHTLEDVFNRTPFERTKVFEKIRRVILWGTDKSKVPQKLTFIDLDEDQDLFLKIKEDYEYLANYIVYCFNQNESVTSRIKAPNNILELGSSGKGDLKYRGRILSSPNSRAWTVTASFLRSYS